MSDDTPQPPFLYDGLDPAPEPKSAIAEVTEAVKGTVHRVGDAIEAGQRIFTLEAMKMEVAVHATHPGEIVEIFCKPGTLVNSGQPLMIYRPTA